MRSSLERDILSSSYRTGPKKATSKQYGCLRNHFTYVLTAVAGLAVASVGLGAEASERLQNKEKAKAGQEYTVSERPQSSLKNSVNQEITRIAERLQVDNGLSEQDNLPHGWYVQISSNSNAEHADRLIASLSKRGVENVMQYSVRVKDVDFVRTALGTYPTVDKALDATHSLSGIADRVYIAHVDEAGFHWDYERAFKEKKREPISATEKKEITEIIREECAKYNAGGKRRYKVDAFLMQAIIENESHYDAEQVHNKLIRMKNPR